MNIKTTLKTSVAAAALVAIAAPVVSSSAEAGINNGNKNSLVVSGQVVRALMYADDGENSELFHTDGSTTASRVRWVASGQLTESVKVGGKIEMNVPISMTNGSATMSANGESTADSAWAIRHLDILFAHKTMGKLSIGQGSSASDGRSEATFSGSAITSSASVHGSGLLFYDDDATKAYTTIAVGGVLSDHDGRSRTDRIRYDSPNFAGFGISASAIAQGVWDVGATYSGKFGGVKVMVSGQYNNIAATSTTSNGSYSGSVALMHDSGLGADFSIGKEDAVAGNAESDHWYVALNYNANLTSLGQTAFQVGYNETEDLNATGDEASRLTFAVTQYLPAGVDLGLLYSRYSLEQTGNADDYDDISIIYARTRVQF